MRMMRRMGCRPFGRALHACAFLVIVGIAASAFPSTASAQYGPQPQRQLFYQNTVVARANPTGLINRFNMQYRFRLFRSNNIFVRDNYVSAGFSSWTSPAFVRFGPRVEFKPIPFVILAAQSDVVGWLGNFDFVNSYSDPRKTFLLLHLKHSLHKYFFDSRNFRGFFFQFH